MADISQIKLPDGVTYNIKDPSALHAHQSVTDGDPTLSWGTKSKVATIGSTDIHVTMPSNPNTNTTYTIQSGDSDGQIKVTSSSGQNYNVSVTGFVSASAYADAKKLVQRNSSGDAFARYFNATFNNGSTANPASYTNSKGLFTSSDGYIRQASAANFRTMLGLGSMATQNTGSWQPALSTSSGALSVTYSSNVTTNNDFYYSKYGNVVCITGTVKNKNAITVAAGGNTTDTLFVTLPTGYRPKIYTVGISNGDTPYGAWYGIKSDGTVTLFACDGRASSYTIAANSTWRIVATYIV